MWQCLMMALIIFSTPFLDGLPNNLVKEKTGWADVRHVIEYQAEVAEGDLRNHCKTSQDRK